MLIWAMSKLSHVLACLQNVLDFLIADITPTLYWSTTQGLTQNGSRAIQPSQTTQAEQEPWSHEHSTFLRFPSEELQTHFLSALWLLRLDSLHELSERRENRITQPCCSNPVPFQKISRNIENRTKQEPNTRFERYFFPIDILIFCLDDLSSTRLLGHLFV